MRVDNKTSTGILRRTLPILPAIALLLAGAAFGITGTPTHRPAIEDSHTVTTHESASPKSSRLLGPLNIFQTAPAIAQSLPNSTLNITPWPIWRSNDWDKTQSVAWGDIDNDGDLDIATGSSDGSPTLKIYTNELGIISPSAVGPWGSANIKSVAWGDVNGDHWLDLVAGIYNGPIRVYLNVNGQLALDGEGVWSSREKTLPTRSIALGDLNGDERLDIAVGTTEHIRVFINTTKSDTPAQLTFDDTWSSEQPYYTASIALSDINNDGLLDLTAGNDCSSIPGTCEPVVFYLNEQQRGGTQLDKAGRPLGKTGRSIFPPLPVTRRIAWGDITADGKPDLAIAIEDRPILIYVNDTTPTSKTPTFGDPISIGSASYARSLSWGDADGDGDQDLAVGVWKGNTLVYENVGDALDIRGPSWHSNDKYPTNDVTWGDADGDGDLDLLVGNESSTAALYRNDLNHLASRASWRSTNPVSSRSVAWGDVNNDGFLDLASGTIYAGRSSEKTPVNNLVYRYRKELAGLEEVARWQSDAISDTHTVAWADYDGDGWLDLAAGVYNGRSVVYRNDQRGELTRTPCWTAPDEAATRSIVWGDVDGDGHLDLAVADQGGQSRVYLNDPSTSACNARRFKQASWNPALAPTESLAWGDVDGDGDLDLAVGNGCGKPLDRCESNTLYINDRGALLDTPSWISLDRNPTDSVAWGDVDGDGDLDLAAGNYTEPNKIYLNVDGSLQPDAYWTSGDSDPTTMIAWGDVDNDGDLDLAAASYLDPTQLEERSRDKVYMNSGGHLETTASWTSEDKEPTSSLAWGDADADGDLDLIAAHTNLVQDGRFVPIRLYENTTMIRQPADSIATHMVITKQPGGSVLNDSPKITFEYQIRDPHRESYRSLVAFYSLSGVGHWLDAVASNDTKSNSIPTNVTQSFTWDTSASGFFGRSDNVVVRLVARPDAHVGRNLPAGPFQFPVLAAQTDSIRVRGTQIRVMRDGRAVRNASVYRLPKSRTSGATAYTNDAGRRLVTDQSGYLQGRGRLEPLDRIVALETVTATSTYSLCYTSAPVDRSGLNLPSVPIAGGPQVLNTRSDYRMLLFNLEVSLEWDARKDTQIMSRLQADIKRSSELLFDWTNGQAALGDVTVYHDAQEWGNADIRVYLSNRLRPNAAQGGVAKRPMTETLHINNSMGQAPDRTVTYIPGQVRIGAEWNRFGETTGNLGEDWPRALAHELGHYLFYLDDNYLGLKNGRLIQVTGCPGAMSDPYRTDYSEFHPGQLEQEDDPKGTWSWAEHCLETLSNLSTGRPDWDTISRFYSDTNKLPLLTSGRSKPPIEGPDILPLAVTRVSFVAPQPSGTTRDGAVLESMSRTLEVPVINILASAGYRANPKARAFVVQQRFQSSGSEADGRSVPAFDGSRIIDLGQPSGDQLFAYGARVEGRTPSSEPADRVCVFDTTHERDLGAPTSLMGCQKMSRNSSELRLHSARAWRPDVALRPQSATQIDLEVGNVAVGKRLAARLYPSDDKALDCVLLVGRSSTTTTTSYHASLPPMSYPTMDGFVHVWVEPSSRRGQCVEPTDSIDDATYAIGEGEWITGFSMGGNAGYSSQRPGYAKFRPGFRKFRPAPVASSDGQVMLYVDETIRPLKKGSLFIIQEASGYPTPPTWFDIVGPVYRLSGTPATTVLDNPDPDHVASSLNVSYFHRDVPDGLEPFLKMYWYNEENKDDPMTRGWEALSSELNQDDNLVSAVTKGSGLYALMTSVEVELGGRGWNELTFPLAGEPNITDTLKSIDGIYNLVYRFEPSQPSGWHAFVKGAPQYVNSRDLSVLSFGKNYLVHLTAAPVGPVRLSRPMGNGANSSRVDRLGQIPPALYFGRIRAGANWSPQAGLDVTAKVGSKVCGEGTTMRYRGNTVYRIMVKPDGTGPESVPGCGVAGRSVSFEVDHQRVVPLDYWDNEEGNVLDLAPVSRIQATPSPTRTIPPPTAGPSATAITPSATAMSTGVPTSSTDIATQPSSKQHELYFPVALRRRLQASKSDDSTRQRVASTIGRRGEARELSGRVLRSDVPLTFRMGSRYIDGKVVANRRQHQETPRRRNPGSSRIPGEPACVRRRGEDSGRLAPCMAGYRSSGSCDEAQSLDFGAVG